MSFFKEQSEGVVIVLGGVVGFTLLGTNKQNTDVSPEAIYMSRLSFRDTYATEEYGVP